METLVGKTVFDGVTIGKILYYEKTERSVIRKHITNITEEVKRFKDSLEISLGQLSELYDKALNEVGETNASIFETHQMMLQDDDFLDAIIKMIKEQEVNAEYAVSTIGDNFDKMFTEMEDDYMKSRAADMKDISERLVNVLTGAKGNTIHCVEPVIIIAEDLAPSETVQLDKSKVLAFVTRLGSTSSHTAILARTMNIPALVGVNINKEWNGKLAAVDGGRGCIYIEPTDDKLLEINNRKAELEDNSKMLLAYKGKKNVTLGGKEVDLFANIGNIGDADFALFNDAGGIGLFRSEFLYLEKDHFPTEEEQFLAYKAVAETMGEKKVIIRTIDMGADKKVDYFQMEQEENPAMGYRAIRICLDRTDIFKTQLRAIYRASAYGNISIMYPMIICLSEVQQIKAIVEEVKKELKEENIEYKELEQGLMIETPAAVMISDILAKEVDFFSIGTNDLTQYTLAIDRQNPKLDSIYDSHHEAVLRMIEMVVNNGHAEHIRVGICGELASDVTLTKRFLEMGIDELSVSPILILKVRKAIRECL